MTRLFFWLAPAITLIFFACAVVLFIAQWIIYYRVEKAKLNNQQETDSNREQQ